MTANAPERRMAILLLEGIVKLPNAAREEAEIPLRGYATLQSSAISRHTIIASERSVR